MPRKSGAGKVVRKSAADIPAATDEDLARLRNAMAGPIDISDIAEHRGPSTRLVRDANGRLPRRSLIRDAIKRELERSNMTPYRLWKEAKVHCSTLSQSAVHEFLKGQRQLELPYAEALMTAVHLGIVRKKARTKKTGPRPKRLAGKPRMKRSGSGPVGLL
jgi:hypothetical protein